MDFNKQSIKTSVVACIIDDQERVLLTRRCIEPFCGQWVMPGGKIDHGEQLLEALHREVREEVGLEIHVDGLIDVYEHVGVGAAGDHYVILYYRAHPVSCILALNDGEVTEAAWVTAGRASALRHDPRHPAHSRPGPAGPGQRPRRTGGRAVEPARPATPLRTVRSTPCSASSKNRSISNFRAAITCTRWSARFPTTCRSRITPAGSATRPSSGSRLLRSSTWSPAATAT